MAPSRDLLTDSDLPYAELQAAALDGDVFRVDRAFCSIAEFDVPWRRAAALRPLFGRTWVVARRSAAWVWGGLDDAPLTHDGFGPKAGRDLALPTELRASDVHLGEGDVVSFEGVRVTSPVRTVVDLARSEEWGIGEEGVVRALVSEHRVGRASCDALLARHTRLPHARRARERLDGVFG
ncbi:hypothetical protein AS850_07590 [Frondihabitans sp. 762G35]|uniref:hypothetical protein n=1 Tax=Frondihabitans sp. 762G35 TaxID=1446794 RepID=UPI000D22CCAC|nr:hypothetical protein [Frondihabitans sp. 762G35]ARC56939.1 hypothetical protein AS850_07590 [Frondihabitans sp. 762G35]